MIKCNWPGTFHDNLIQKNMSTTTTTNPEHRSTSNQIPNQLSTHFLSGARHCIESSLRRIDDFASGVDVQAIHMGPDQADSIIISGSKLQSSSSSHVFETNPSHRGEPQTATSSCSFLQKPDSHVPAPAQLHTHSARMLAAVAPAV